jgi:hypothetical protein
MGETPGSIKFYKFGEVWYESGWEMHSARSHVQCAGFLLMNNQAKKGMSTLYGWGVRIPMNHYSKDTEDREFCCQVWKTCLQYKLHAKFTLVTGTSIFFPTWLQIRFPAPGPTSQNTKLRV